MPTSLVPITPTESDTRHAQAGSRTLARLLQEQTEIHLHPNADSSDEITLPASIARLFQDVLEQIGKGQSVIVVPLESELTTGQAAEIIGVSRPFLVELLEEGEIPFHLVGTHRRVRLADVLAYRQERERRFQVMEELIEETDALGLYP